MDSGLAAFKLAVWLQPTPEQVVRAEVQLREDADPLSLAAADELQSAQRTALNDLRAQAAELIRLCDRLVYLRTKGTQVDFVAIVGKIPA